MKTYYRFEDTLINENDTSELKAYIKNNYTLEEILNVIDEWTGIGELLEAMEIPTMDENDVIETEDEDLINQLEDDPREGVNPYKEFPEYPHEI